MSTKAPNPVDKYVGSRVRMRRIMLGMSQEKLGEALGLTFQQVQKYEKGTNRVGASRMQQISEILAGAGIVPVRRRTERHRQQPRASAKAASPAYVSDFLATSEGLALTRAFTRIPDAKLRRSIVDTGRTDRRARRRRQALIYLADHCRKPVAFSRSAHADAFRRSRLRADARANDIAMSLDGDDPSMRPTNPFDSATILDGIRRWVEIETPTEAPGAGQQARRPSSPTAIAICPSTVERVAGHDGCGDHLVARSSWGQDAPGILVLSHLDTVHPMGFIERLPFRIEGDSAFGPGIYDMKGGAYLAYHAFRADLRRRRRGRRSASPSCMSPMRRSAARPRAR